MKRRGALHHMLFLCILILSFPGNTLYAQENTLSIATYYPSPDGVFSRLIVKQGLIVGDISASGLTGLQDPSQLTMGQIYTGYGLRLKVLTTEPASSESTAGEVAYIEDGKGKSLRFFNGSEWVSPGE